MESREGFIERLFGKQKIDYLTLNQFQLFCKLRKNKRRPYKEVLNERTGKIEKQYDGLSLGCASSIGMERTTTLSNF